MTLRTYIVIFIITLIVQFYSRFIYLLFKNTITYSNYSGEDIGYLILKDHNLDVQIKPIKNSNNYELYNFRKSIIYLKKSIYHKTSITSIALAAQRTFMYICTNNIVGRIRMHLEQFIEVCVEFAWILIGFGLIVQNDSILALGIVTLFVMFIYNLIYLPLQIKASFDAYNYLTKNIIEKEECHTIQHVLIINLLFFTTNYSQPLFDLVYYLFKAIIHKLKKVK